MDASYLLQHLHQGEDQAKKSRAKKGEGLLLGGGPKGHLEKQGEKKM